MRQCGECGATVVRGAPDPCLGMLPGVSHACCGHGDLTQTYVVFGGQPNQHLGTVADHVTLRYDDAREFFAMVKRGREREREQAWVV